MADYELFEKMTNERDLCDKHEQERNELSRKTKRISDQCEDVSNKYFSCLVNRDLHQILTVDMNPTEKKFNARECIEYQNKRKKNTELFFSNWYDLEKKVSKR